MWSCKSFLHICADVPSISEALLATSYPNTQIEFRPQLRMLRIVRVSCRREDKHPQHHLANDLGVHVARVGARMFFFQPRRHRLRVKAQIPPSKWFV